jgi:pimeloyl-ACP methyl ester carboxylesterase
LGRAVTSGERLARLHTMPGLDHNGPLMKPDQVAAVVTAFLLA